MNTRVYLLLLLFVLLITCKKKTLITLSPAIVIGNTEEMEVQNINKTITGSQASPAFTTIDVNNDGTDDIRYDIYWSGTPGNYASVHEISLLNGDISLTGGPGQDTSFLHYDTTYINTGGNLISAYLNKRYTFKRQSTQDSVYSLNHSTYIARVFSSNEVLRHYYNFSNSKIGMINYNADYTGLTYITPDTNFIDVYNLNINRYPYPLNKEIYFGLRISDNGITRLGWMKFKIVSDDSAMIIETAIQKN